jgi:PKHD-type hydroxylase
MVRSDAQRTLLFDLDNATQSVNRDMPSNPAAVQLTGIYHNLLRQWAEV